MTTERDKGREDERKAVLDWLDAEIEAIERLVERLVSYGRPLEDYRRIRQAIARGDHHQPKP